MDRVRFDAFIRALGQGSSRRTAVKTLLGLGGVVGGGAVLHDTDAARRGAGPPTAPTAQPTIPAVPTETIPPTPTSSCPGAICNDGCCDGACTSTGACCPAGSTVCGPDCCPNGTSQCCDNACCYGTCYGEELCCATGSSVCSVDGCCSGICTNDGQFCCPAESICGNSCCDSGEFCCEDDAQALSCVPNGGCCSDSDCSGGSCVDHQCVAPPTATSTATATPTPSATPTTPPAVPAISLSVGGTADRCTATVNLANLDPGTTYVLNILDWDGTASSSGIVLATSSSTPNSNGSWLAMASVPPSAAWITAQVFEDQAPGEVILQISAEVPCFDA